MNSVFYREYPKERRCRWNFGEKVQKETRKSQVLVQKKDYL